ncbi:uncharacterized protein LOC120197588 [Hibiscus syriacus]|uniref:uncharacterized protein LOC120197588 n=1 Tax=Hibiscus syriacus TaxID=106335 RepID=UPI001922088F|nr:uncharacterized protein LOC120197588 [Hibiscus syriacus]
MESAFCKSSAMSTSGDRDSDNGCQSMSAWIDSILKTGNSSLTHSSLQNLRTLGRNYDASASRITDDVISDRRRFLKCGVKAWTTISAKSVIGNYALPVIPNILTRVLILLSHAILRRWLVVLRFAGRKNLGNIVIRLQTLITTTRKPQSLLDFGNHVFAASSLVDATKPESRGDVTKSVVVPLFPELPLEGSACSKGTNNMVSECSTPKIFHCGSNTTKFDPLNAPMKTGNCSGRQLNMPELGFCRLTEKGKVAGLGCVPVGFSDAIDPHLESIRRWKVLGMSLVWCLDFLQCSTCLSIV